jgi:tRNA-specific 2-thiouridylase
VTLQTGVTLPIDCEVVVRYRGEPIRGRVGNREEGPCVEFEAPSGAVVPGQVAVFYDGDRVLGGGTVTRAIAVEPAPLPAVQGAAP